MPNGAWVAVFAVLMAWFGYRVVRDYQASGARALAVGHCAPHLVHSAAMVYMFAAITAPAASSAGMGGMGGMSGMSTLHVPTLAFVFALILVGYTIWDLDQLSGLRHGLAVAVAGAATPAFAGARGGTVSAEAMAGSGADGTVVGPPADIRRGWPERHRGRRSLRGDGSPGLAGDRGGLPDRHGRHDGADADPDDLAGSDAPRRPLRAVTPVVGCGQRDLLRF